MARSRTFAAPENVRAGPGPPVVQSSWTFVFGFMNLGINYEWFFTTPLPQALTGVGVGTVNQAPYNVTPVQQDRVKSP